MMRRPPQYTNGNLDRHGKARWYFRRAGFKKVALPGLPWSPEFMAAYQEALAGQPAPVGINRARPGSVLALAISYFASPEFRTLKPSTQKSYRWTIGFCREHGDKRAADLRREHIVRLMAARGDQPGAANALRIALRVMMKHAVDIGLRADEPTRDVRAIRAKTQGHHTWTESEIEQFERHHQVGSRARLDRPPALHRTATRRRAPNGGATYSRWRRLREAGEDGRRTRDPTAPEPSCRHCRSATAQSPYVRDHETGWPVSRLRL